MNKFCNQRKLKGWMIFLVCAFALTVFTPLVHETFAKGPEKGENFSLLKITEVSVRGSKLHIRGETDLPAGSSLHLKLDGGSGIFGNGNKGIKIHVNSHFFFVQVDLPKGKNDKNNKGKDIFRIRLRFDPSGQQEGVRLRVGPKGENLAGKYVKTEDGVKVLQFDKFLLL